MTTQRKIISIFATLSNNQEDDSESDSKDKEKEADTTSSKVLKIRGIPKSGRFWKSQKERFSTINKTKGLKQSFAKKTELRLALQRTKALSKQMAEEIRQKDMDRKERRRENIKRTEENKRKSEVVQVITNTAKLRRMRKKQLRFIEKRDTTKTVEKN